MSAAMKQGADVKHAPAAANAEEKGSLATQVNKLTRFHEQKLITDPDVIGFLQWSLMPFISLALSLYILYVSLAVKSDCADQFRSYGQ